MYIQPVIKIYTSFDDAKDDVDKYGHSFLFDDREGGRLEISDLAQGNRNLIVGEPGVGKTELLKKFKEHHDVLGHTTCLVNLRMNNASEQIDAFISQASDIPKILILDALDEVKSSIFPGVLQKIETISKNNPDITIYLSSRWIFISKYSNAFPEYRFIRIMPFSTDQVREYLVQAGNSESDVGSLIARIMQFSHGKLVLQVPRYLFFLVKFIKDKTINNISQVSRNELFEYFIYSKLDIEDKNLNTDTKAVIKRVLEKLALTMEIYQTNTISKDELMTFFDDIESDLKLTVLSHITLDVFFARTILQESTQDIDSIEFENTEFQEYLAAKEITRFSEPHRVAFSFATDENIDEILPSWFNSLTFLVDMIPDMLEQLLEFSGLRSGKFKIADEGFLNFLSRVNPINISQEFRRRIFMDVMSYHEKTKQWLPGQLADALPGFFIIDLEDQLKTLAEKAESEIGSNRYVPLGNVAYVVAYLFEAKVALDKPYWRKKLISYVKDVNENGVLQRHALLGLQRLEDKTVIDDLPDLSDAGDELVAREFLSTHIALNPDHPKTLVYAIKSVKRNDISGRYGLFELKERSSILTFLKTYIEDEQFRKEFLDDTSVFGEKDSVLISNIKSILDSEIEELCKEAIVKSIESHAYGSIEKSAFVRGLVLLLKEKYPKFIPEILRRIHSGDKGSYALYLSQDLFVQLLEKEDVSSYLDIMIEFNENRTALNTMIRIKYSKRPSSEEIFESGRLKLSTEYTEWEIAQKKSVEPEDNMRRERMLKEFRIYLQPTPGQYSTGVFQYYNEHADELDQIIEESDKKRLSELITGSILNHNPAEHGLKILERHEDGSGGTKTYRSSNISQIFGAAFIAAKRLGIDVSPYHSNIALYIPFAYDNELKEIFESIKDFTSEKLEPVMAIYKERNTDLWKHQPGGFIDLVQRYHLSEAIPVLRTFVKESSLRIYDRKESLQVADSLSSDPIFLKEIFDIYINSDNEEERDIAYTANGLLITSHGEVNAIVWRIGEIKKRATAYVIPRSGGVHNVGPIENELRHDKSFAKPLLELKHSGFEDKYLEMLGSAIEVWGQGKEFHAYAQYMWEIVYSYFENLKEYGVYTPLKLLEEKIASLREKDGINWLASSMVHLRRSYLKFLGRPRNFSEAIRKYNEARAFSNKNIRNSADLFRHLRDMIETDLRKWVEYEGAYNIIVSKKKYKENKEYEKLVQMTLKSELSNICRGRGFKISIAREEQLLSDKRTDFIIRYGFVGPIILEVKLASNSDLKKKKLEESASYVSMGTYMNGYGASHGIFLIMDDTGKPKIIEVKEVFGKIPNVLAMSLDCYNIANAKKKVKKVTQSKKRKTKVVSRKKKTK